MLARLIKLLLVLALLAIAATLGAYLQLRQWAYRPAPQEALVSEEVIIDFPKGTPLARLAESLETQGLVSNRALFQAWVRLEGSYGRFQAGKYRFNGALSPQDIINKILRGDVYHPVVLQVTIPEGWTMRQIIERLAAHGVGHVVDLRQLASDPRFITELGIEAPSLEGYLYPATYNFTQIPTPAQAFQLMTKTFFQNLPKAYEQRVAERDLSLQQAVIFASLIEAETRYDDERPLVSEVIWRRLKAKMPLGIDASLIYGISDYQGDLKWSHLSDASNQYNSRIHRGLPPGPIGSPAAASLEAVLNPADYGYYYYVLIPGSGRHQFSKTLKEHNQHVKKLVRFERQGSKAKQGPGKAGKKPRKKNGQKTISKD